MIMMYRATTAQRGLIRSLLGKAELETSRVSLVHQPVLAKAGLWCSADNGTSFDHLIDTFTKGDASRLITVLQEHIK